MPQTRPTPHGFSRCISATTRTELHFPNWFTAVGYNDISKTLVFIGFYANGKEEAEKFAIAETDFAAFLKHYYGEWYNWE